MSRENVELVERMLREAQHNPDALYEVLDDDVHWDVEALNLPDTPPTYCGPEGVREFFRRWVGTFDEWGFQPVEMIDAGDSVVAHITSGDVARAAAQPSISTSGRCGRSATGRSCVPRIVTTRPRPSKPWGCGSRRCRGRTSNL